MIYTLSVIIKENGNFAINAKWSKFACMKKILHRILFTLPVAAVICGCGDDRSGEFHELTKENQWVYAQMKETYLWGDSIKEPSQSTFFSVPEQFFGKLLYKSDKISFFGTAEAEDTYGMQISLMRDPLGVEPARVYALVENVEPQSVAANAGIERGMYISKINGTKLNMGISESLSSGSSKELELCHIVFDDETGSYTWEQLSTVTIEASAPILPAAIPVTKIFESTSSSVGYILCNSFDYADDVNTIQECLQNFATAGVNNMILDLRYNTSVSLDNAIAIASSLVPAEKQETLFCTLYRRLDKSVNENRLFIPATTTFADIPLYIVTTERTAGISSALVRALRIARGSANVKVIGKQATGNSLYTERLVSPYGFEMSPVTAFIYDAGGNPLSPIAPDYEIDEFANLKSIYPLGDRREHIVNSITYLIANGTMPE